MQLTSQRRYADPVNSDIEDNIMTNFSHRFKKKQDSDVTVDTTCRQATHSPDKAGTCEAQFPDRLMTVCRDPPSRTTIKAASPKHSHTATYMQYNTSDTVPYAKVAIQHTHAQFQT